MYKTFTDFIASTIDNNLNLNDMILSAEIEKNNPRRILKVPGENKSSEPCRKEYVKQITNFIEFLKSKRVPLGVSPDDIVFYEQVAHKLTEKGEFDISNPS
ncbi:MAG: hypothetical protein JRE64_17405 [Deltaproteobacteria bacterium]|nr:hypothetical protein [Deltaproteobacteria bacterium]